jgi:hypothetical protein
VEATESGRSLAYDLGEPGRLTLLLDGEDRLTSLVINKANEEDVTLALGSLIFDPDLNEPEHRKLARYVSRAK